MVIRWLGGHAGDSAGTGSAMQDLSCCSVTYTSTTATFNFQTPLANCQAVYTASTGQVAVTTTGC